MEHEVNRTCQICGKKGSQSELLRASMLRPVVVDLIKKKFPNWSDNGFICLEDMNRFRSEYVFSIIEAEKGELSELEKEVVESLMTHEILSSHVDQEYA